jgi:TANFOR domain-containing protein
MLFDRMSCFVTLFFRKMRAGWNCILLVLAFFSVSNVSHAQVYPVQATVQLAPPYSLYLGDYVESGSERLALNIFLSDIARPDLDVRFRLKIIGQGITLETKPGYIPAPVSIQGGVPLRLISTDLAEYFNPNNLTFQGLSLRDYVQRGKLPEGVYQFCFEVLEYNRGLKISNTACAVAWLVLNDPPIINLPRQNEKVKAQSVQNVLFQWTPRHTGSPNSAFTTEYEVKMVEVWPDTRNPNDAILTSPPILEETTRNTTFIFGPGETPLEPGRRYAFRVQAKSISGVDELDLFKNHGYSEVVSFVYGDACDLPTGISIESVGPSRFALRWESLFNQTAFKVRYRQEGTVDWYENNASIESTQILSLKPSTTYEYQVAATCGFFYGDYSPIARVTTAEEVPVDYSCGIPLTPFNLDPSELTGSLKPGDIIQAGDFQVQLISVNGSNGIFSGEGIIEVPYLNKARVKTSFTNITVSKELRMVNGFMNVTGAAVDVVPQEILDGMEQLSELLEVVDTALNIIEENIPEQIDWNSFVADTLVAVSGEIIGVNKNEDGSVTVTDSNGQTQTLPAGNNYALKDDAGNGYLVDKKGNIHATSSAVATKLANREYNLLVTFRKDAASNYGFDQSGLNPPDDTEVLEEDDENKKYKVAWKSVATGRVDGVIAGLEGSSIDKSKIRFELGGIDVQAPPLGADQTTGVGVTGKSDGSFEALLALYAPSDTAKEQVLGKLRVASYDEIPRKLVIVPVNDSFLPASLSATSIRDSLNAIYHQAVVHWEVEVKPAITVTLNDQFDDGGSGLLSNYTGDMKKVINAYGTLEEDTYYLFLVSNPSSGDGLGYMPRGKEAGFIFVDKHGSSQALVRTIAHEVGHGAFNLAHTFDEVNFPLTKGSTDNLMDYPAGNKLYKYQWDKMRYPDIVVGLFEQDEAGEYKSWVGLAGDVISNIPGYEDSPKSFLSAAGDIITLPSNARDFTFFSGYLVSFTIGDERYIGLQRAGEQPTFSGYFFNAAEISAGKFDKKEAEPFKGTLVNTGVKPKIFYALKDQAVCGAYSIFSADYQGNVAGTNSGGIGNFSDYYLKHKIGEVKDVLANHQHVSNVDERINCLKGRAKELFKFIIDHYNSHNISLTEGYEGSYENDLISTLYNFDQVFIQGLDGNMDSLTGSLKAIKIREMLKYGHRAFLADLKDLTKSFSEDGPRPRVLVVEFEDFNAVRDLYLLYQLNEKLDADCVIGELLVEEIKRQRTENGKVEFNLAFFSAVGKTFYELHANEVFELITCLLKNIRAPESIYNPNRLDYVFEDLLVSLFEAYLQIPPGSLEGGIPAEELAKYGFACACGAYNSVIDLALGLSELGDGLTTNPVDLATEGKKMFEGTFSVEGIKGMGSEVWTMLKDHHGYVNGYGFDSYQASYGACYDVVFVASFFVGVGELKLLSQAGRAGEIGEMARIIARAAKAYPKNAATTLSHIVNGVAKLSNRAGRKLILELAEGLPQKILIELPPSAKALIIVKALDEGVELFRLTDEGLRIMSQMSGGASRAAKILYQSSETFTDMSSSKSGYLTITEEGGGIGVYIDDISRQPSVNLFLDDPFIQARRAEVLAEDLPSKFLNHTIEELTAIKTYTSDDIRNGVKVYHDLNLRLRTNNLDEFNMALSDLLNSGLNKLEPYNGSEVFRGVYGAEADLAKSWKVGDDIIFPDFKSSSISEEVAQSFMARNGGDVIFEISNPKGYNICEISCLPTEGEILFKAKSHFKVVDLSYAPRITENDPVIRVIKLKLIE